MFNSNTFKFLSISLFMCPLFSSAMNQPNSDISKKSISSKNKNQQKVVVQQAPSNQQQPVKQTNNQPQAKQNNNQQQAKQNNNQKQVAQINNQKVGINKNVLQVNQNNNQKQPVNQNNNQKQVVQKPNGNAKQVPQVNNNLVLNAQQKNFVQNTQKNSQVSQNKAVEKVQQKQQVQQKQPVQQKQQVIENKVFSDSKQSQNNSGKSKKIKKIRNGEKSILDLHGLSVQEAQEKVINFITEKYNNFETKCTIITGRGNHINANGSSGVLKQMLPIWAQSTELKSYIKNIKLDNGGGVYKIKLIEPVHNIGSLKFNNVIINQKLVDVFKLANEKRINDVITKNPKNKRKKEAKSSQNKSNKKNLIQSNSNAIRNAKECHNVIIQNMVQQPLNDNSVIIDDERSIKSIKSNSNAIESKNIIPPSLVDGRAIREVARRREEDVSQQKTNDDGEDMVDPYMSPCYGQSPSQQTIVEQYIEQYSQTLFLIGFVGSMLASARLITKYIG